jgi:hypothetical protein
MNRRKTDARTLNVYFNYEAKTGFLFWKPRLAYQFEAKIASAEAICNMWNSKFAGKRALTSPNSDGYLHGKLNSESVSAHGCVWALFNGEWPSLEVDHIDGDKANNRISNLRLVTRQGQNRNSCRRSDNTSGATGVSYSKNTAKWRARILVGGKQVYLGYFEDIEDAIIARKKAEEQYGYHDNHGRAPLVA